MSGQGGTKSAVSRASYLLSSAHHVADRELILGHIERSPAGLTSRDIERILGKAKHKFSGRLTKLEELGQIKDSGLRRDGCRVMVAVAAPKSVANPKVAVMQPLLFEVASWG